MHKVRHMTIFAQIVESGSITAAAEQLGLSKSVVSQHLKQLENELGTLLLKRSTRRQQLTPVGGVFFEQCQALTKIAGEAWREAQDATNRPSGKVRITAPNALMDNVVAPAIASLTTEFPELQPELLSSDERIDILQNNIDLAFRVGRSPTSNLKQQRIGQFRDVLCCSKQLSQPPSADAELMPYIANQWQGREISHEFSAKVVSNQATKPIFSTKPSITANSLYTCVALLRSGAGVAIIPDFMFRQFSNELIEVFPDWQLPENPVFALHPFAQYLPLAVRMCLQGVARRFA